MMGETTPNNLIALTYMVDTFSFKPVPMLKNLGFPFTPNTVPNSFLFVGAVRMQCHLHIIAANANLSGVF